LTCWCCPSAAQHSTDEKFMALTAKQQRFVAEYLVDLNATRAAMRAGYSARTARSIGAENLTKVEIADAVSAAQRERQRCTEAEADRVLRELARVAFFDPRKLFNADGGLKPLNELDGNTAAVLVGMDVAEIHEGSGTGRRLIGYTKKLKLADKVAALGLAMRHLGMLKDRTGLTGKDGGPVVVKACALDERL
jgi:phage terminase small subunit